MKINIRELIGNGGGGVFLLLDLTNKQFYINYSHDVKYVLASVIDIARRLPANSELEFCDLSKSSDIETLKLHTEYWIDYYKNLGFTEIQSRARKALRYAVRILVAPGVKGYDVQLVSARGSKYITVGRFPKKKEAEDFVLTYYAEDNPYKLPVYSTNSLTRELLSRKQEEVGIELL